MSDEVYEGAIGIDLGEWTFSEIGDNPPIVCADEDPL
jgi:hypothetical protein